MDKFTYDKYNIGVNHEHLCLALRRLNNIKLNNLTIKNKASSVEIHLPNRNIHIELKHRHLSSDDYIKTLFEKTKFGVWISSKRLSEACLYICFGFADGKQYFIKCDKELFESFDT